MSASRILRFGSLALSAILLPPLLNPSRLLAQSGDADEQFLKAYVQAERAKRARPPVRELIEDPALYAALDGVWFLESSERATYGSDKTKLAALDKARNINDSQMGTLSFAVGTKSQTYIALLNLLDKNQKEGRDNSYEWQGSFVLFRANVANQHKTFLEITFDEAQLNGEPLDDFKPLKVTFAFYDKTHTPDEWIRGKLFAVTKLKTRLGWWDDRYNGVFLYCEKQKTETAEDDR
jgi:hypothetical protein